MIGKRWVAALLCFGVASIAVAQPKTIDLWLSRAQLHARQNQWEAAERDFARALALEPENPRLRRVRAD